jgi:hypothetical protein
MSFPTHEKYDENEYFILFNQIHPYLYYANDEYNLIKREFQNTLLNNFKNNKITKIELNSLYNEFIKKENEKFFYIENLKQHYSELIKSEETKLNTDILNYATNYINTHSNN